MYYVTIYCIDIVITCGFSGINIFLLCCKGITFVLRKLCIRIILVHATLHLISLVCLFICLFVHPIQGWMLLYLYFVIRFCYNICNIKLIPSWFPSISPPGNYLLLLDYSTPIMASLGLSLVAAVGSSTGWISCLNTT